MEKVQYPEYLHGNVKKRGIKTNALSHAKTKTLINEDIESFFNNCNFNHIQKIWKYVFNFSDEVSEVLSKLVTLNGVLPQGSCTSPQLSNLVVLHDEFRLISKASF